MKNEKEIIKTKEGFNEILLYTTPVGKVKVEIYLQNDTIWLSQQKIAGLFAVQRPVITKHINNIFKEGELENNSIVKESLTTAEDAKDYKTKYYNLDGISSIVHREVVKIVFPEFDIVLNQFGVTPSDYRRMSIEELAGMEK